MRDHLKVNCNNQPFKEISFRKEPGGSQVMLAAMGKPTMTLQGAISGLTGEARHDNVSNPPVIP
jgi:hypothetical protein